MINDEALDWGRSQLLEGELFWGEGDRDEAAETGLSGGAAKPVLRLCLLHLLEHDS
ncbi:MAG: hypothetical protein AAF773_12665 [Cyanobacteria bacterium P01_D01_bin.115]